MNKDHIISINTLTDYHLEQFMHCPYKFYQDHIIKNANHKVGWKQLAQLMVNKIVKEFYQLPMLKRNSYSILKLIHQYSGSIKISMFDSKVQYYSAIAAISDHLIKFLLENKELIKPLFLHENHCVELNELDIKLSMNFEVAEWSGDTFVIKKYVIDDNPEHLQVLKSFITVFSLKAFSLIPEKVEVYSLIKGKKTELNLSSYNYSRALTDISMMKNVMSYSKNYTKNVNSKSCEGCSAYNECLTQEDSKKLIFHM